MVSLTRRAEGLINRVYATVAEAGRRQLEDYSDRDLRTIHDFLARGNALLADSERELRGDG